jgi:hypothetical protein
MWDCLRYLVESDDVLTCHLWVPKAVFA